MNSVSVAKHSAGRWNIPGCFLSDPTERRTSSCFWLKYGSIIFMFAIKNVAAGSEPAPHFCAHCLLQIRGKTPPTAQSSWVLHQQTDVLPVCPVLFTSPDCTFYWRGKIGPVHSVTLFWRSICVLSVWNITVLTGWWHTDCSSSKRSKGPNLMMSQLYPVPSSLSVR